MKKVFEYHASPAWGFGIPRVLADLAESPELPAQPKRKTSDEEARTELQRLRSRV
jgi:hypothetical protein